ncbi:MULTISPECIES: SHOCT domain-containing protein [unclassified Curtobacterium]|uniref:SHOCT domain-containing protein n=1 Tax=Bacteria TaxID=2 RepID=UPI000F462DB6|nr:MULTISPECIES: SHOCT domain-containing protein [unclassified Curtobacterium]NQW89118.1 SHOCT domain-containing protein [Curtobacterium sp. VKM Ac-2861]MBF4587286.1 SHOCT domain-containing protein [Curtobacterium sp. VKM Ac-2887]ROQ07756.1 phospholipase D-like protein [Curtobacterium sp. PhB171]ROQ23633.1 phospholipase D-like protein [Curtobacterium sp. PhB170]ROS35547.1 phospholipase D-like protein [Curtobacterium sp. PhB131]
MDFWYTFWAVIWYGLLISALIASLMALFSVLADLVRDRSLSGWYKAIWVFFLVFVPFLTTFVYLIARGRGMADRSAESAQRQKDAADGYIRTVAGTSPSDEIAKARALLDAGTITAAEFDAIKANAVGSTRAAPAPAAA